MKGIECSHPGATGLVLSSRNSPRCNAAWRGRGVDKGGCCTVIPEPQWESGFGCKGMYTSTNLRICVSRGPEAGSGRRLCRAWLCRDDQAADAKCSPIVPEGLSETKALGATFNLNVFRFDHSPWQR